MKTHPATAASATYASFFGSLLGLFIAAVIGFHAEPSWTAWALLCVICAAVCAWFALHYGDGFWHRALQLMRWW